MSFLIVRIAGGEGREGGGRERELSPTGNAR